MSVHSEINSVIIAHFNSHGSQLTIVFILIVKTAARVQSQSVVATLTVAGPVTLRSFSEEQFLKLGLCL